MSELPKELQDRIQAIKAGRTTQPEPQPEPEQQVVQPNLTLMGQLETLREENVLIYQQLTAMSQVIDAVGQAVGQMYSQQQELIQLIQAPAKSSTASQKFTQEDYETDY